MHSAQNLFYEKSLKKLMNRLKEPLRNDLIFAKLPELNVWTRLFFSKKVNILRPHDRRYLHVEPGTSLVTGTRMQDL